MQKLLKIIREINEKPVYNCQISQFPSLIEKYEADRMKYIIMSNLDIIEHEIDELFFSCIKNCHSIGEATVYFDVLQKIQEILAMLYFKETIEISDKLKKFIYDCDRLDDNWLRDALFQKVKEGAYNYNFMG